MLNYKSTVNIGAFQNENFDVNGTLNNEISNKIIYKIYLPIFKEIIKDLFFFLNSDEQSRAKRFHKEKDKNRFIISRSILKFILSAHAKIDAKNITLDFHSNKKPYLASHPKLFFNVSHSEDYAVIAVSNDEVGIDLEYISDSFEYTNLLSSIFTESEIVVIENAADKKHTFYTFWTRKEAFVKALGTGIDDDFINIPCLDGHHNVDSSITGASKNWQIDSFEIVDNYLCSVAFSSEAGKSKEIQLYNIPNTMDDLLDFIKVQKPKAE